MLFNSTNIRDRGIALANKICQDTEDVNQQISMVFEQIFNRKPSEEELLEAGAFLTSMQNYHSQNPSPRQQYPVRVEREMFEEMTGENFRFTEKLRVYENYEPDLKAWQVTQATRALADYIVILFNTNEFIYVY